MLPNPLWSRAFNLPGSSSKNCCAAPALRLASPIFPLLPATQPSPDQSLSDAAWLTQLHYPSTRPKKECCASVSASTRLHSQNLLVSIIWVKFIGEVLVPIDRQRFKSFQG